MAQEVFGGMTTVNLGFTRGSDDVGKRDVGFFDHGQALALPARPDPDPDAHAGSRARTSRSSRTTATSAIRTATALVFGAAVPERVPRTRTSRSVDAAADRRRAAARLSVRGEYRYFWDTWDITSHTFELGLSKRFGENWLVDAYARTYRQDRALFYSNNATSETLYVTRNRQLGTYDNLGLGARVTYTWKRVPGRYEIRLNGALEQIKTDYSDFTDIRTGSLYSYSATRVATVCLCRFLNEGQHHVEPMPQPAVGRPPVPCVAGTGAVGPVDPRAGAAGRCPCTDARGRSAGAPAPAATASTTASRTRSPT